MMGRGVTLESYIDDQVSIGIERWELLHTA